MIKYSEVITVGTLCNVPHGLAAHPGWPPTFAKPPPKLLLTTMSQQQQHLGPYNEHQIQIALQALDQGATLSLRCAAAIYNVPRKTLSNRRAERSSQADRWPKSRNLEKTVENVLVKHIIDLVTRGFPPRLAAVADMANSLRAERNLGQVGVNWPSTFVKRRPELTTKFNRKYDYERALCKDPEIIQAWFGLVANIKAKYGIQDEDTYNYDEAGFMMGQISTGAVVTASERRGWPKMVQQSNRE
jgi:hypothetical protein